MNAQNSGIRGNGNPNGSTVEGNHRLERGFSNIFSKAGAIGRILIFKSEIGYIFGQAFSYRRKSGADGNFLWEGEGGSSGRAGGGENYFLITTWTEVALKEAAILFPSESERFSTE
jgi:hypothetical protein